MKITPEIFVINLDVAVERRAFLGKNCLALKQPVTRFAGIDGSMVTSGTPLFTRTMKACYLSHLELWKRAVCHIGILEDDVTIHRKIEDVEAPDDFDIVYLSDRMYHKSNSDFRVLRGWGLEGYIVSPEGAEKLIAITEDLDVPVDNRVQAHIRNFDGLPNGAWGRGPQWKGWGYDRFVGSRLHPDIIIEAYCSEIVYVTHPEINYSYIRQEIEEKGDNWNPKPDWMHSPICPRSGIGDLDRGFNPARDRPGRKK